MDGQDLFGGGSIENSDLQGLVGGSQISDLG